MYLSIFLLVLAVSSGNCDWDLAVLTASSLELLGDSLSVMNSIHLGIKDPTTLAYDPLYQHHYFASSAHRNASIFRVQVSKEGHFGGIEPLVKKQTAEIIDLAYDAESTSVFWTRQDRKILKSVLNLGEISDFEVLHEFNSSDLPYAIAVEPCTRYLYWSYQRGSIERSLLDGTKRETVVEDLNMPLAISISQAERRIYWVDIGPGYIFKIGRALLDGSNKEIIFTSESQKLKQRPSSLVVMHAPFHGSVVYWTDSAKLWSLKENKTEPELMHNFDEKILALQTADIFDKLDEHLCSELINMRDKVPSSVINPKDVPCVHGSYSPMSGRCICTPGYTGTLCETSVCYNYCLSGSCSIPNGIPTCRCPHGRSGSRCEVDSCQGYCYKGNCSMGDTGVLSCSCQEGWYGQRCNASEEFCNYACGNGMGEQHECRCNVTHPSALTASSDLSEEYKLGFFIAASTCGALMLCMVGLLIRNWRLGKRPRVKRTYKVTPNKKSSVPQPVRTSPDCEIAIENCCNMNICETPCYEPELRPTGSKGKKEEKQGLLKEMEVQPDLGQTF